MTRLNQIRQAHDEMGELMTKLRDYGANDTEPDYQYQNAVLNAVLGRKFVNMTADEWELYSDTSGVDKAAKLLNVQTRKITKLILGAKVSELHEIREWVHNNLWRVDL